MDVPKHGKALTWEELADLYPGTARILPMETVFNWAKRMDEIFYYHPVNETLHLINKETVDAIK